MTNLPAGNAVFRDREAAKLPWPESFLLESFSNSCIRVGIVRGLFHSKETVSQKDFTFALHHAKGLH
jgi:hypothetical protein